MNTITTAAPENTSKNTYSPIPQTHSGRVKWFSQDKGFGFIVHLNPHALRSELYFNSRDVKGPDLPRTGDRVTFTPVHNQRGPRATRVAVNTDTVIDTGTDTFASVGRSSWVSNRPVSVLHSNKVQCHSCGRAMVSRILTGPPLGASKLWTPVPKRSICPFCAATHQVFPPSDGERVAQAVQWVIGGLILLVILGSCVGVAHHG